MTLMMDYEKGIILIPKEVFESKKDEFISFFQNFILQEENNEFITIQLPTKLPNKKEVNLYFRGIEKVEKTCIFCSKRIRCATNGWKCNSFKPAPSFDIPIEQLEIFLSTFAPILFVKVDN